MLAASIPSSLRRCQNNPLNICPKPPSCLLKPLEAWKGRVWFGLRDDGGSEIADKHDGSSLISTRPDLMPLLVIDVWEHAYYLDYNDVRAEFVEGSQTAIDWEVVERRRQAAAGYGAAAAVSTSDN